MVERSDRDLVLDLVRSVADDATIGLEDPSARTFDICAAVLARMAPGWQDIASAPRDGTSFLVYEGFEPAVEMAWWNGEDVSPSSNRERFWQSPTHWMPLPPAPSPAPQTGEAE